MNHKRLYVGDLAGNITESDLQQMFTEVGKVEQVTLVRKGTHGLHGFAFVEMVFPEDARAAVQRYNGTAIDGSRLIVYTVPPKSRPRPVNGESQ
ncbi:MAG TPA: RNA-binding protein [Aggregatilineales bacterium]|nr:RNA-binding protein [Anaerolineales bacterium]HRE49454.1 RNA-binding protein [Aggregatilineales bacterium]